MLKNGMNQENNIFKRILIFTCEINWNWTGINLLQMKEESFLEKIEKEFADAQSSHGLTKLGRQL